MANLFYTHIRMAHEQCKLDSSKVDLSTSSHDSMKTAVFYMDGEGSHDFYLRKSDGNLVMDSPAGPPRQVLSVVERIAQLEGFRPAVDKIDVPREFREALEALGYRNSGSYYIKDE